MSCSVAPSIFIPHGGGPLPLLGHPIERDITKFLSTDVRKMMILDRAVKAIVVITAHWESNDDVMISSGQHHELLYDYVFDQVPEAYTFKYEAPGHPQLARRIHEALRRKGVESTLDDRRGWDHGTFVPMILINPKADIPIVQVSILANQDTKAHWNIGEALIEFRNEGVAILGSGMSYHNMNSFAFPPNGTAVINLPFDSFLDSVCDADESDRKNVVLSWKEQEGALEAHPLTEADHFMPFIVNAGAAGGSKCRRVFTTNYEVHFRLGAFLWA